MSPALNGSSAIRYFEGSDAIEIRDGIAFDFTWDCHIYICAICTYLYDFELTEFLPGYIFVSFVRSVRKLRTPAGMPCSAEKIDQS